MLSKSSATNSKDIVKAKVDYYGHLHLKDISDNRKFLRGKRPLFSDKIQTHGSFFLTRG